MPRMKDPFDKARKREEEHRARSTGKFEVVDTSPFMIYVDGIKVDRDGNDAAVPGVPVVGLSYSVGTTGRYILDQGQQPLCFPTP